MVEPERSEIRDGGPWRTLAEFSVPSEPGNECEVMARVKEAVAGLVSQAGQERLGTAVAETTMNAIEHGNQNRAELPVEIRVLASERALAVRITDQAQSHSQPVAPREVPDLEAKLAGAQSPRGWGLFLVEHMVDEMHVTTDERHHTVELILYLEGEQDGGARV